MRDKFSRGALEENLNRTYATFGDNHPKIYD